MELLDPPIACTCGRNATLRVSNNFACDDTHGNTTPMLSYRCKCGIESGEWMLEAMAAQAFRMKVNSRC